MLRRIKLLLVSALAVLATPSWAASFDCAKASTAVEKMICGDRGLDARDSLMGKLYEASLRGDDAAEVKAAQTRWLPTLQACTAAACLKEKYDARIGTLLSTKGARAASSDFLRKDDGDPGQLTIFGPVDGLLAISIASTHVGRGGAAAGDVNADGLQGVVALEGERGRLASGGCTVELQRVDAGAWQVNQGAGCSLAGGVTLAGRYRR